MTDEQRRLIERHRDWGITIRPVTPAEALEILSRCPDCQERIMTPEEKAVGEHMDAIVHHAYAVADILGWNQDTRDFLEAYDHWADCVRSLLYPGPPAEDGARF